jgi:hypothetical protein
MAQITGEQGAFLIVLEAGKSKIKVLSHLVSVEGLFLTDRIFLLCPLLV